MAEQVEKRVAGRSDRATAGEWDGREPEDAGGVPVEFACAELCGSSGGGISDLQHDFGFGSAAAARDWNCTGAGSESKSCAGGVLGRSGVLWSSRSAGRAATRKIAG